MRLLFVFVGHQKHEWLNKAHAEYFEKLKHLYPTEILHLKPATLSRESALEKKNKESQLILDQLKSDDLIVLCDENGRSYKSGDFAKAFESWLNRGKKRICFVVGGAFGANERLKERADIQVSLSQFVLNHLVAQVVLLEQVYRAIAINRNLPYHNE